MPVIDCESGVVREHTPDEQAAIDAAPKPRREIAKSDVHARLVALGKLAGCWSILSGNPDYLGRWLMPGHPDVYADDADLLAVFHAAGLTADQIAQVVA